MSDKVLESLSRLSRDLSWLALGWHVLVGVFLAAFCSGWRPSRRRLGILLAIPLFSVSVAAWVSGNPFNGSVFLVVALATLLLACRLDRAEVTVAPAGLALVGAAMIAFGWAYPHFLGDGVTIRSLWAAPLGLLPCPTLSLVVGLVLLLRRAGSKASVCLLGGVGVFYGLLGWLWLGVTMDVALFLGSTILLASTGRPADAPPSRSNGNYPRPG